MIWKTVTCAYCNGWVPLRPRLLDFRPMPKRPACPGCGMTNEAPPSWRYTYYFYYAWRLAALGAIPLVAWDASQHGYFEPVWLVFTALLAMSVGGFAASFVLAVPVWIVVEALGIAMRPLIPGSLRSSAPRAPEQPAAAPDASAASGEAASPEPSEFRRSA